MLPSFTAENALFRPAANYRVGQAILIKNRLFAGDINAQAVASGSLRLNFFVTGKNGNPLAGALVHIVGFAARKTNQAGYRFMSVPCDQKQRQVIVSHTAGTYTSTIGSPPPGTGACNTPRVINVQLG